MKPRFFQLMALGLASAGCLAAQMLGPQTASTAPVTPVIESSATVGVASASAHLTAEQLDQLLGPIALYPDALIALIFPSATVSSDVVLAARYLVGGDPARIDDQPWDDSVKALAHYPDLVKWMDENLAWTKQVGEAFLDQPAEVMKSVQRLRAAARAAGTLIDTPQQQVVAEAETISIVPTQPDVIYVPYYDPAIVYLPRRSYYSGSFLSFSVGYPVGFWLGYNFDWGHRRIWIVERRDRERYWRDQHDWRRPTFPSGHAWVADAHRHPWSPRPGYSRSSVQSGYVTRPPAEIVRPSPISRGWQHSPGSGGDRSERSERTAENRGRTSRSSAPVQSASPALTQSFQSAPAAPPAQNQAAPAPASRAASAPPTVYSRGNRSGSGGAPGVTGATNTSESSGESRVHRSTPSRNRSDAAPIARSSASAPVVAPPAPVQAAAPAQASAQPVSRGHHERRAEAVASAPQAAAPPASSAPSSAVSSSSSSSSASSGSAAPASGSRRGQYSRGGRD